MQTCLATYEIQEHLALLISNNTLIRSLRVEMCELQTASYLPSYDSSKGMSIRVGLNGYAELFGKSFAYQSCWSDSASWPDNTLPQEGDDVMIQEGDTVLLDISPPALGVLRIYGQLLFTDAVVRHQDAGLLP